MHSRGVTAYMPALILFVGFLFVLNVQDQQAVPLAGRLETVLSSVEGMRIQDQVVSDEERRVAGMSDYVARLYWRDTTLAFTTYVGYYDRQTQGKTIHSPRNCLPGAGWEVLRSGTSTVTSASGPHTINHYLLKNGATVAVVYYWYQGRGRIVANEYRVKLNLLRDAALEGHTEEALVRVVVPVAPDDTNNVRADELGIRIAARLMDDVARVLPHPGAPPAGRVAVLR
jgi:EpsI family protein